MIDWAILRGNGCITVVMEIYGRWSCATHLIVEVIESLGSATFPILDTAVGCILVSLATDQLMKSKKTKAAPGDEVAKMIFLCSYLITNSSVLPSLAFSRASVHTRVTWKDRFGGTGTKREALL